jgi:hypothetical protein
VGLNQNRAAIAEKPEESDYTAIQQRIRDWQQRQTKKTQTTNRSTKNPQTINSPHVRLMPLVQQHRNAHTHATEYTLKDYLQLVMLMHYFID